MAGTVPISELFERHWNGSRYWQLLGETYMTHTGGTQPSPASASAELAQAEASVEAHSAGLKKELGVRDLTLTQILFIVGLTWIGVAGKLGPSHVIFWFLALVLFYLPSAAVVMYLNGLMPLEGGLYQWAKLGFNQTIGFLLAWNLWLYVIVFTSEIGLSCATYLSYAIGPSAAWMTSSAWFAALSSAVILSLMILASTVGLAVGKWVHNTGGVFMLIIFGALILLPFIGLLSGHLAEYHPFRTAIPAFTLLNLNILGKMGFGALGGFEYIAILAGETKSPTRTMRRSVLIAAPIIAIMFVLGTATVVAYVPTNDIDLVGPLPQVLRAGFGPFGIAGPLVTIAILMTLVMRVAQASVSFTAVTRLPMVAGWDRMLPAWFSKLHRKYQTPVNSILVVGACSFVLAVLSNVGVGQAEAFQLLFNASGMFYALTYVVMFSIPLFGLRGVTPRPPLWLKVASTSGLLMTVLYIALSVFPIIKVESVATFAFKILSVIVVMNVVGIGILMTAKRRVARAAMVVAVAIASGVALTGAVAGALTATASTASAQDRSQSRSMVTSQSGIVASESVLASQVGARILEQGGNAIDAAIATNAMMGLVAPMNDGIGGDLFAIVYEAKTGKLYGLNASGWAPAKLTADFLLKQGVTTMPMKGIHTVTVPGAVDGWDKLLKKFGTKTFVELLAPAIHFAEQGFPVAEVVSVFWKDSEGALQSDAPTARTFLINGHTPAVGEVFRNPDLAWTYKQLATNGRQAFYTGEVAKKIIATSISHGGTMTPADLAEFQGEWVEPISTTYKGWTVHELPPNGQGIAALEMLNIMETFPLAAAGQNSVRALHFMIEAKKLAYADMQRYDADPRFAKVPVAGLNSKDFARERAKLIDATRANCAVPAGKPMGADNGTTYLSVVDRAGNMVSLIQSNYSTVGFGSGLAVGGAGFVLHNRGGGFTLDKTSPNVLAGRKRPFHTIIPAFMNKGDVRIAFGIMGGFNQAQAHAQFVSNIADFGLNIQGALDAPRFSKETFEGCDVGMESRIPDSTRKALIAMGHQPVMRGDFSATRMGAGQAVMRNFATGVNFGASDPRKDGAAVSELVLQSKPGRAGGQPASRRMVRQP